MGLIEMMVQIENVNKVLNPITTLLEGTKTTIEREFNIALQPVVNILVKLGEIIGQVLLIPLEYLSWCIESVGAPILLLVEFIKMFAAAVKPIVVLVMKLLDPVIMLLDILNTFVGLSTSAIEMEAARQAALQDLYDKELKSLQDLYNVGALSGAEYEAGLAALKSRYPTEEGGTQLSPREQAFADWLQGIWTGINAIALWCENAYASWIAPIIEALDYIWAGIATPELTLAMQELGVAFGGLADSMSGVMLSLIQIIADILVALAPLIIWFMNTFLLGILIPAIQLITATIELFAGAFGVVANIINLLWGAINWFFSWIMGDSTARKAAETTMYYALLGIQIGLITMANGVIYAINALYLGAVGALNALITLFHGDPIVVQGIPYIPSAATGTGYLPSDMTIQAHKGEIIAPNSFASEIRKGNLTLSGPRSSGSGGDVYNVTVNGSILTEREVISLVAEGIHSQKVKGYA
jgi:ABC-type multidrug transport system fused ATPase/permease subunit